MERAENFTFRYDLDHGQWSVVSGQKIEKSIINRKN